MAASAAWRSKFSNFAAAWSCAFMDPYGMALARMRLPSGFSLFSELCFFLLLPPAVGSLDIRDAFRASSACSLESVSRAPELSRPEMPHRRHSRGVDIGHVNYG